MQPSAGLKAGGSIPVQIPYFTGVGHTKTLVKEVENRVFGLVGCVFGSASRSAIANSSNNEANYLKLCEDGLQAWLLLTASGEQKRAK